MSAALPRLDGVRLPAPSALSGPQLARLPLAALLLIAAAFVIPGLVGHDPWKQDETYVFGIVHHMLTSGDWVVPQSGGLPFVEKPPLYYWTAAVLANLFSPVLPMFDGARLATGLFMTITLVFTGLAARNFRGRGHGRLAALALIACLGLFYETHLMTTNVPHMAGFAVACYGFSVARARPFAAGVWIGTGVGMSFLGKGLLAPGVLGVTALLLPVVFTRWRTHAYPRTLAFALVVALPWLLGWPVALYLRSPELFHEWFWMNNVGRFLGFSVARLGASNDPTFWIRTLPWYAFPALPLAALTLWRERGRIAHDDALQFGALSVAVYLVVLLGSASARGGYALPMLIALALLAAPSVARLPSWLERSSDLAARAIAAACVALLWAIWGTMAFGGSAPAWPWLARVLPLDYSMPLHPPAAAVAAVATVAWLMSWRRFERLQGRAVTSAATGLALAWLLIATLWLPWIDHAKSYRSVIAPLRLYLPDDARLGGVGLDESVSAMLPVFAGTTAIPVEDAVPRDVDALLVQNDGVDGRPLVIPPGWEMVWNGARPGDARERFRLFLPRGATMLSRRRD